MIELTSVAEICSEWTEKEDFLMVNVRAKVCSLVDREPLIVIYAGNRFNGRI